MNKTVEKKLEEFSKYIEENLKGYICREIDDKTINSIKMDMLRSYKQDIRIAQEPKINIRTEWEEEPWYMKAWLCVFGRRRMKNEKQRILIDMTVYERVPINDIDYKYAIN